jgi:hypothetical protein
MAEHDSKSLDILGIKPIADSVNRVTRAAVDGASAFLSRICLPAAEELGLLFRDKVANWRARNAVAIVEAAKEKLEAKGGTHDAYHAHPRIVGNIIESGSWSDSDEVQELWAGLLTSSCSPDGTDESNLIFTNLLSQLTSLQAKVISHACAKSDKEVTPAGWLFPGKISLPLDQIVELTAVTDIHRLDRELDHLRALDLISGGFETHSRIADITPTPLALHMYARCKGHSGDPCLFYGVAWNAPAARKESSSNTQTGFHPPASVTPDQAESPASPNATSRARKKPNRTKKTTRDKEAQ